MSEYKKTKLLDRFFVKQSRSLGNLGPQFYITRFAFGYGLVDEGTDPPTLLTPPGDLEQLPNVFYTGVPVKLEAEGRLLLRCPYNPGDLSEPKNHTLTGFYDQDDELVGVALGMPQWIHPDDPISVHAYIDFTEKPAESE